MFASFACFCSEERRAKVRIHCEQQPGQGSAVGDRGLRTRVLRVLRNGDDRLHRALRGARRRVLFDGETAMHFSMFETLAGSLRGDPRVAVRFTSSWQGGFKLPREAVAALLGGVSADGVPYRRARWQKWDLYVSSCFDNPWFARRVPWADTFHGVGEKWVGGGAHLYMAHPLGARYDRLLCPNDRLAEQFRQRPAFVKTPESVRVTGMARSDLLVWFGGPEVRAALRAALGITDARPAVLFAPTWGTDGALAAYGEDILRECAARGLHAIVKLHSCSYLDAAKYSGGVNWRQRLDALAGALGFRHAPNANLTALILAADLMIADFGSAPVECCAADRPLIFFRLPAQERRIGGDGVQFGMLCAAGGPVTDLDTLRRRLDDVLDGRDGAAAARRRLRDTFFHAPGQATENCLRQMYELMELDVPAGLLERYRAEKRRRILAAPAEFLGLGAER
jgi:hypothetical protein